MQVNKDLTSFRDSVFTSPNAVVEAAIEGYLDKRGDNLLNPWQVIVWKATREASQAKSCLETTTACVCDPSVPPACDDLCQTRYFTLKGHYLQYFNTREVANNEAYCLCAIDINLVDVSS